MKSVIALFQTVKLRQVVASLLLAVSLFVGSAFGSQLQAQAKTLTPEVNSYDIEHPNQLGDKFQNHNYDLPENQSYDHKSVADNIREKLNLDEPLPRATKEFFNDVQEKAGDVLTND